MLTIVDGECAMPVDPSTNSTCEFQTRNDCWPWITVVFCEHLYLHLNTTTSQTTLSPHLQHLFNSKYEALCLHGLAIEEKSMHMLALSFSIRWMTFDYIKIPESLKILFLFFIFMFLIHGKTPDMIACTCTLVPSRFSSSKAKSTPWQVVSVPQRLTLEIQYGLPTYPQVEQGWDFPEVVLWHVNLQIRW